jgi:hypothetical protein
VTPVNAAGAVAARQSVQRSLGRRRARREVVAVVAVLTVAAAVAVVWRQQRRWWSICKWWLCGVIVCVSGMHSRHTCKRAAHVTAAAAAGVMRAVPDDTYRAEQHVRSAHHTTALCALAGDWESHPGVVAQTALALGAVAPVAAVPLVPV